MDNYIDPKRYPEWYSAQYTEQDRKVIKEICENPQHLNYIYYREEVAEDDPNKALDMMLKLSEYFIPKLARQELTGADGKDLFKDIKFEFGD
jgi:hypothetical protein